MSSVLISENLSYHINFSLKRFGRYW